MFRRKTIKQSKLIQLKSIKTLVLALTLIIGTSMVFSSCQKDNLNNNQWGAETLTSCIYSYHGRDATVGFRIVLRHTN